MVKSKGDQEKGRWEEELARKGGKEKRRGEKKSREEKGKRRVCYTLGSPV